MPVRGVGVCSQELNWKGKEEPLTPGWLGAKCSGGKRLKEEERHAGEKGERLRVETHGGGRRGCAGRHSGVWGKEKGPGPGGISRVETTMTDAGELTPQLTCW